MKFMNVMKKLKNWTRRSLIINTKGIIELAIQ